MPYRALVWTFVTVALALGAVGFWMDKVGPMLADAQAATQASGQGVAAGTEPGRAATEPGGNHNSVPSEKSLRWLVHGTLLLSFVLICMLLVVGLGGALREWMRYRLAASKGRPKAAKTVYVDAWKIAGERMKEKQPPLEEEGEEP